MQFAVELVGRLIDARDEVLRRANDMRAPGAVAKVSLYLAEDRRNGEADEGRPAIGVEAFDRPDERVMRNLHEVFGRLAATSKALRERVGKARVRDHDLVALLVRRVVAIGPKAGEFDFVNLIAATC